MIFSLPETEPLTRNLGQIGMESIWFLVNIGSLFILLLFFPLLTCVYAVIYIVNKFKQMNDQLELDLLSTQNSHRLI